MKTHVCCIFTLVCLGALVLTTGCGGGGGSSSGQNQQQTQTPVVSSISPTKVIAGAATTTLTVNGGGFVKTTVIQLGQVVEPTTFVSSTQVTASIGQSQLATAGMLSVIALNGNETSASGSKVNLEVDNPNPSIAKASPASLIAGQSSATVSVTGTGFVTTTLINVNGSARTTVYVSATQVNVNLTTADLAAGGTLALTAVNPTPGGGTSPALSLPVNNPPVGVIQLNPNAVAVGTTSPTTITVTGSGFIPSSTVQVNGANRATTYVSPTQLAFQLTVADEATSGVLTITAANPAPGGGTSSATLTIGSATPTPTITTVNPAQFIVGSSDTTIEVQGTGFSFASVVQWNGVTLQGHAFNSGGYIYLYATVPASDLTTAGSETVTVNTATANPATSNAVTVQIGNPPVPTVTSLSPDAAPINADAQVAVYGNGFTQASTISFNGTSLTATYVSSTELTVTVPAASISLPGNYNVNVTTPAPGGGISAPATFTGYIGIVNNSMVYNPANGLFYVSVPSSAGQPYGNSVVSVDPETGALGMPIYVGSEPNKLAISSDGTILWVGLDGASAIRQVNLTTNTAGLQFSLGSNSGVYANPSTALALAALPGAPNSVVVSATNLFSNLSIAIYDSGVLRGSAISGPGYDSAYALQVDGTRNEVYAGSQSAYSTYTYGSTGLTQLATASNGTYAGYNADEVEVAGGRLYTDFGTVFDAESGALLGTFYSSGSTVATGTTYADTTLGEAFILDNVTAGGYSNQEIQIFNTSTFNLATSSAIQFGSVNSSGVSLSSGPSRLSRWGMNGLAFRNGAGVFSLRSNLVKDLSTVDADLGVTLTASGGTSTGSNATYKATVTNAGPAGATNVALTALVPSTGVLISAASSAGPCTTSAAVACNLGSLANGASVTVTFVVEQLSAGNPVFTVQVNASETDPNLNNNQATSTLTVSGQTYNLPPAISSLSPAAVIAGSADTETTVTGSGFSSASTVSLNGNPLATSLSSPTQLVATVPAAKLANMGWAAIAVTNAAPGGGTSAALPLTVYSVITLGVNRIVYDPYSRNIMASVGSGSSQVTGNSILAITPETGSIGTPVSIGSQPTNMALTDDGQILYAILAGSQSVARFNMLTQQAQYTYSVPSIPNADGIQSLRGVAAQPGTENTVALDLGSWAGNAIFDFDPVNQTAAIRGQASGPYSGSCIQFLDAGDLLAFDTDTSGATFDHYTVTSAGFTYYNYSQFTESTLVDFGCFALSGGLAFANGGGVANPATSPATQLGIFKGQTGGQFSTSQNVAPDTSLGEVFFVENGEDYGAPPPAQSITSFSPSTFLPESSLPIDMTATEGSNSFSIVDLIRWGQDGLAILTNGGHIYLLRGGFVVPGLLSNGTAATLTSSSASTIMHGAGNTLLTLTGSNFQPGVAVTWNGSYRTTTIVDATHVTVAIPASDLAATGNGELVATNPGGMASPALTITIN